MDPFVLKAINDLPNNNKLLVSLVNESHTSGRPRRKITNITSELRVDFLSELERLYPDKKWEGITMFHYVSRTAYETALFFTRIMSILFSIISIALLRNIKNTIKNRHTPIKN